MTTQRHVFFVSDRTGITAEMLGKTLLSQFPNVAFDKHTLPFIDPPEKAHAALAEINKVAAHETARPLILSTLIDAELRAIVHQARALCLDLFGDFINSLELELGMESSHALGLTHGIGNELIYEKRMAAVNYALAHDDGITTANYKQADVILVGVSRTGKTPTCLYLAMQYAVPAANYPFTPDDFGGGLPKPLASSLAKLYGLTIKPERLAKIRHERKPDSRYADLENCRREVAAAEEMFHDQRIPYLDTTLMSVEEIAITILHKMGLTSHPNS